MKNVSNMNLEQALLDWRREIDKELGRASQQADGRRAAVLSATLKGEAFVREDLERLLDPEGGDWLAALLEPPKGRDKDACFDFFVEAARAYRRAGCDARDAERQAKDLAREVEKLTLTKVALRGLEQGWLHLNPGEDADALLTRVRHGPPPVRPGGRPRTSRAALAFVILSEPLGMERVERSRALRRDVYALAIGRFPDIGEELGRRKGEKARRRKGEELVRVALKDARPVAVSGMAFAMAAFGMAEAEDGETPSVGPPLPPKPPAS